MEYKAELEALASDILDEAIEHKNDDIYSLIHEAVDGHEWIIYTRHHEATILTNTENPDAYLDVYSNEDLGRLVADNGLDHARMVQAFYAMAQDLSEIVYDLKTERINELEATKSDLEDEKLLDELDQQIEFLESM